MTNKTNGVTFFLFGLTVLGLAVLLLTATGPQILSEVMNDYYIGENPASYAQIFNPLRYGAPLAFAAALTLLLCICLGSGNTAEEKARFCVLSVWGGMLLARFIYCAVNIRFYTQSSAAALSIVKPWEGGLAMSGVILSVWMAAGREVKRTKNKTWYDRAAIALSLFIVAERLLETGVSVGYGHEVEFEGFLTIADEYGALLNVSILEALIAFALVIALFAVCRRKKQCGNGLMLFFLLYGASQVLMESLRADRHMIWGFVKVQQLFAMLMSAYAAFQLCRSSGRSFYAVIASLATAGLCFFFEKMLDRNWFNLSNTVMYAMYAAVLLVYAAVILMLSAVKKTAAQKKAAC